jgi:hypothetical protein
MIVASIEIDLVISEFSDNYTLQFLSTKHDQMTEDRVDVPGVKNICTSID